MKLKKLFKDLDVTIRGNKEVEITGICSHSQFVAPGNLFIARCGHDFDGTTFIQEALDAGAIAVLTDLYNPFLNIPQVLAEKIAPLESILAQRYYDHPSEHMFVVGITGTNGKTTTSYLIQHLLGTSKKGCGLIGTIECVIGQQRLPSKLTTPDVVTNHKLLREMLEMKTEQVVMEVTSHALDQGRVLGIDFNAAIFTNLSQDHLDYHGTMERYSKAKSKLFAFVNHPDKLAIVNCDDVEYKDILGESRARVITYGLSEEADVCAKNIQLGLDRVVFDLRYRGHKYSVVSPLIGRFNVYNTLAALALSLTRGIPIRTIVQRLAAFKGVPGRLQKIPNPLGINLFVDFAHTDEALERVLETLVQSKNGKLIVLFGCGGDRDSSKRPKMARAVETFADEMIVTSDNPRHEDPKRIAKDILSGFQSKKPVTVELDRRSAIQRGIAKAKPGDVLLIAGRGHEPFQLCQGKLIPFNDSEVALDLAKGSPTE